MTDTYCNNCGHRSEAGANFCSACGAVLHSSSSADPVTITFFPDATEDASSPDSPHRGTTPALVALRGPKVGSRYELDQDLLRIGRHPDSDIFLDDVTVSRRHAELASDAQGVFRVRDVGSLNGTYVNQQRVDEAVLADGDELQVGSFKLTFVVPGSGDAGQSDGTATGQGEGA